ncbi:MAG: AAA family ATPase [Candidatus Obscuribacterales bacterium]|nr:AAA family ATPase [Candidatus Obscuribacterales bacterium]
MFNLNKKRFSERAKSLAMAVGTKFCDSSPGQLQGEVLEVARKLARGRASSARANAIVVGPPGSGKTTILIETVRLLLERNVEPGAIALFVKSAELADRLRWEFDTVFGRKLSPDVNADGIWCCSPETLSTIILRSTDYKHNPRTSSEQASPGTSPKIVAALAWMRSNSSALSWRFRHLLIDDYESFDESEFELISRVASSADVIVFGDHCQQTIEGRKARESLKSFGEFEEIRLSSSLRLSQAGREVLNRARASIEGVASPPLAKRTLPADIRVIRTEDRAMEAFAIGEMIKKIDQECPGVSVAVVFRDDELALPLRLEFANRRDELCFRTPFSVPLEFLPLLHALRFKACVLQGSSLVPRDAAQVVSGYYGNARVPDCIGRLDIHCYSGFTPDQQVRDMFTYDELRATLNEAGQVDAAKSVEKFVRAKTVDDTLEVLVNQFSTLSPPESVDVRAILSRYDDDIASLINVLVRPEQNLIASMKRPSVDEFLGVEPSSPGGLPTPVVCSFHAAKRHEFHSIIIASCNEACLPGASGDIENERRLFYSMMGRARCNIVLTYTEKILGRSAPPSQLLRELSLV